VNSKKKTGMDKKGKKKTFKPKLLLKDATQTNTCPYAI